MAKETRGERNCNPLNIVKGSNWKGLRKTQTDSRFCQFESMLYGWRAGLVLLRNYIEGRNAAKRCYDTIEKIISRWAPATENNTEAYIRKVSEEVGLDRRIRIKWRDRAMVCQIVKAMAHVECGKVFPLDDILSAYDLLA